MARVLVLMTRPPAGAGGRGQVLQTIVDSVSGNGHEVVCAVVGGPAQPVPVRGAVSVHRLPDVHPVVALLDREPVRRGLRSYNERLYYSRRVLEAVRDLVAAERIDLVVADGVRLASYAEDSGVPWFVDLDDLLSARYELWRERRMDLYQLLGHRRPRSPLAAAILRRIPVDRILGREAVALREREISLARSAGGVSLVSLVEAGHLQRWSGVPVRWLPMAVTTSARRPLGGAPGEDRRLAFAGSLTAFANEEAVLWWINELHPALSAAGLGDWRLHVFGEVPEGVRARVTAPSVVLRGAMPRERLHEELAGFTFAIAPQREALGLTVKVVEAAVLGLVTITTPQGASGLGVSDGDEMLLVSNGRELAQKLSEVERWFSDDPAAVDRIALRGQRWAERTFSPEILRERWAEVVGQLVKVPAVARRGIR